MVSEKDWLKDQIEGEDELLAYCQELCDSAVSNLMPKVREKALENNKLSDLNILLKFDMRKKKVVVTADTFVPPIITECRKF